MYTRFPHDGSITSKGGRAGRLALAAVTIVGGVAIASHDADAANDKPKAKISGQELVVDGTFRSDVLVMRLSPIDGERLVLDFGGDGVSEFDFARPAFDRITVNLLGGNDLLRIDETHGVFTNTETTTIVAGTGNDVVNGGAGAETIRGGTGADVVDGGAGNDIALLGDGNDRFQWDPGDGRDVVEGREGHDVMLFNGSSDNER